MKVVGHNVKVADRIIEAAFLAAVGVNDVSPAAIEKEIPELEERKLIFWQNKRLISLVLPDPATETPAAHNHG